VLLVATLIEASGDAVVRMALYDYVGPTRLVLFAASASLLFGYGLCLNLAPLEFSRVIGLYIATLFLVWQFINFIFFRTTPTLSTWAGGALIVAGGCVVTYWKPL
jgi:drug/metabolite transporter (DMT)-like permease